MTAEEYIQALRDLMRIDWEDDVAEEKRLAELAEAQGNTWSAKFHRDSVERLEAMDKPWEKPMPVF
ncbi:hypothetical protein HDA40_000607 [Hamadaea flava]|uniref:Uncharacterized protein n=1 Tax=Hamadaea flava TaxID=1742688 RepID=A0ABV8LYP8_9ACTN|nr:hypothetical protein [Hamadaea flava]MCP2322100.1 hypothetical protein [Hamadaea flava]